MLYAVPAIAVWFKLKDFDVAKEVARIAEEAAKLNPPKKKGDPRSGGRRPDAPSRPLVNNFGFDNTDW